MRKIERELRETETKLFENIDRELDEILELNRQLHQNVSAEDGARLTCAFAQGERYGRLRARKQHEIIDFPRRLFDFSMAEHLLRSKSKKLKTKKSKAPRKSKKSLAT